MPPVGYVIMTLFSIVSLPFIDQSHPEEGAGIVLDNSKNNSICVGCSATVRGDADHVVVQPSKVDSVDAIYDLRTETDGGTYLAGSTLHSFYPLIGADGKGDRSRAQDYIRMNSRLDGSQSEIGLVISGKFQTGYVPIYANNIPYALGALVNNRIGWTYRVTKAGTSAAKGSGPLGDGTSPIVDGSAHFSFVCHGCNARSALFVDAIAKPGAGPVWGSFSNVKLEPGWRGGFSAGWEIDSQNDSGADCATCQTLFLTGDLGDNLEQAALSAYTPPAAGRYKWIEGVRLAGASTVRDQAVADYTSARRSYYDSGTHSYGLYMAGSYSSGYALYAKGWLTERAEFPRLELFGADGANRQGWRILSGVSGNAGDGALDFQHTKDGFVRDFTTPIKMNADGSVKLGSIVQLPGRTVAQLPICNKTSEGSVAYVVDSETSAYNAPIKGGGGTKMLALCDGSIWSAH